MVILFESQKACLERIRLRRESKFTRRKSDKWDMKTDNILPKFFQYYKELDLPVMIKVEAAFLNPNAYNLLKELHFTELTLEEFNQKKGQNSRREPFRILVIEEASVKVSIQINRNTVDDRFGPESVTTMVTHKVYRYKDQALLVYSQLFREWHMGCYEDFASEENIFEAKMILNRFLGWALSSLGLVGFWGTPVAEGAVITRPVDAKGEAIFFDMKNRQMLTIDGVKKIKAGSQIIRLDSTLVNRNVVMKREELVGFLNSHTVYLDPSGTTVPVRQMIQELSSMFQGIYHPANNFKPRVYDAA